MQCTHTYTHTALLSDLFPPRYRGAALGTFNWGIYMGYSAAYGLGNIVTHRAGWRAMFIWFGAPGIAAACLVACMREPKRGAFDSGGGSTTTKVTNERRRTSSLSARSRASSAAVAPAATIGEVMR